MFKKSTKPEIKAIEEVLGMIDLSDSQPSQPAEPSHEVLADALVPKTTQQEDKPNVPSSPCSANDPASSNGPVASTAIFARI